MISQILGSWEIYSKIFRGLSLSTLFWVFPISEKVSPREIQPIVKILRYRERLLACNFQITSLGTSCVSCVNRIHCIFCRIYDLPDEIGSHRTFPESGKYFPVSGK